MFNLRHPDLSGKETSYSDGSEAPKTEGGLPARLFYNDISPPKSEEAGRDACTTLLHPLSAIQFLVIQFHPISIFNTLLPRDFRMSENAFCDAQSPS